MDICTVETGLLKKKPCGQPGVTHCLNCEQALCSKHAVPLLNEGGRKTGKFMCKECFAAQKECAKIMPTAPTAVKKRRRAGSRRAQAAAPKRPAPARPKPTTAARQARRQARTWTTAALSNSRRADKK